LPYKQRKVKIFWEKELNSKKFSPIGNAKSLKEGEKFQEKRA
jgi:hypothetical protein